MFKDFLDTQTDQCITKTRSKCVFLLQFSAQDQFKVRISDTYGINRSIQGQS